MVLELLLVVAALAVAGLGLVVGMGLVGLLLRLISSVVGRRNSGTSATRAWAEEQGYSYSKGDVAGQYGTLPFETREAITHRLGGGDEFVRKRLLQVLPAHPTGLDHRNAPTTTTLGDEAVEKRVTVATEEAARRLDSSTRKTLSSLWLKFEIPANTRLGLAFSPTDSPEHHDRSLASLQAVHDALASTDDSVDVLAGHLGSDPNPRYVSERLKQLPATEHARFHDLLNHREEPEIQVWCAYLAGDAESIRAMAHATPDLETTVAAQQALGLLGAPLLSGPAIQHVLQNPQATQQVLSVLEDHPTTEQELLDLAAWSVTVQQHRTMVSRALARCLNHHGPPAEAVAIALLVHEDPTTESMVLAWLDEHGTVRSVPELQQVLDRTPAARDTIRAVQSRATGERGGLAISDAEGGGLSEVTHTAGALSAAQRHPKPQLQ